MECSVELEGLPRRMGDKPQLVEIDNRHHEYAVPQGHGTVGEVVILKFDYKLSKNPRQKLKYMGFDADFFHYRILVLKYLCRGAKREFHFYKSLLILI